MLVVCTTMVMKRGQILNTVELAGFADLDVECKRKKRSKDDSRFHQSKWEDGVYDAEEA